MSDKFTCNNNEGQITIKNLGFNLKKLRKIKKLTQEDAASHCALSVSQYQKIENNYRTQASFKAIIKISIAFDVPIDMLLMDSGYRLFEEYSTVRMLTEIKKLPDVELTNYKNLVRFFYDQISDRPVEDSKDNSSKLYIE